MYWKEKEVLNYPNAKRMVQHFENKVAELQAQQAIMAQQAQDQVMFDQQLKLASAEEQRNANGAVMQQLNGIAQRLGG